MFTAYDNAQQVRELLQREVDTATDAAVAAQEREVGHPLGLFARALAREQVLRDVARERSVNVEKLRAILN